VFAGQGVPQEKSQTKKYHYELQDLDVLSMSRAFIKDEKYLCSHAVIIHS